MKFENIIRAIRPHSVTRLIPDSGTGGDFFSGEEPTFTYTSSTVIGFWNTTIVERYVAMGLMDINDRVFVSEVQMSSTDLIRTGTTDYEIRQIITTEFIAYTGYNYILQEKR